MRRTPFRTFTAAALLAAGLARADVYSDGNLTVDWTRTGNDYAGTFTLGDQKFAAKGHATDTHNVVGSFQAGAGSFDFSSQVGDTTLTLTTGGKTYTLARKDAPANPLGAAAAPANPLAVAPAAAPADLPPGYAVVNRTDAGVSLKTTKPAKTVADALSATLADVAKLLDARPTVAGSVEDQQTHKSGVAVFSGTQKGKPVRGVASCQVADSGSDVSVVIADASAPPEAWQKLSATQSAVADTAARVPMREYQMPDGTGTVGLPDGWTTKATSMLDPMEFDGPNDARLTVNGSLMVYTPNCQLIQLWRQTAQMGQRVGMPPPPKPPGIFADFAAPSDAILTLVPQINAFARQANLPTVEDGKLLAVQPTQSQMPNGRAQLIEDTATWVKPDGTRTLMHGMGRYESAMIGQDAWLMTLTSMVARDADFAQMQPVMAAILDSGKIDQERCNMISQQRNAQMQQQIAQTAADNRARLNAQFEAGQAAHREQMASYDRYNHNWAVNENLKSRSNDNFIEYLGGTRTVVDTATGQRQSYDLNDADGIANGLNAATNDPNRFRSIPLRDENHPLMR